MTSEHGSHPAHPPGAHGTGYETRDASPRKLLGFGIGLVVVVVVVQLGLLAVYGFFRSHHEPVEHVNEPVNIYEQLRMTRESEDNTLTGYGWVDRKAGVVRIPIERAFDLVVERGVPKGKGPKTAVEINSHHGTPVKAESKEAKP